MAKLSIFQGWCFAGNQWTHVRAVLFFWEMLLESVAVDAGVISMCLYRWLVNDDSNMAKLRYWSALMLERMQTSMDHHHHLLFSIILKQIFGIYGIIHIIVNIALAWRFNCISKSIKCRKLMKTKICHYLKQLKLNLVLLLLIHIKF